MNSLAQRVLSLCEEVHKDVTGYLGVEPRPCPIVLDPGTDIFNGFMGIFPSKISLYETPLYTVRGFGPGSDLMDLVFTHEYTHYVHITTRLGWYGELTKVLGDGLAISNALSPGWVVEGITTNTETMFTDGGRGRSALFKGEMMSFTEGQGLWDLNSAAVSSPYSPPGSRIYLAGYPMVDYMNRTYGQDAFARLSQYQARHPLGGSGEALNFVTGKSPQQFYLDFLSDYLASTRTSRDKALSVGLPQGKVVLAEDDTLDSLESHLLDRKMGPSSGSGEAMIRRPPWWRSTLAQGRPYHRSKQAPWRTSRHADCLTDAFLYPRCSITPLARGRLTPPTW